MAEPQFKGAQRRPPEGPRKVRSGVKLRGQDGPEITTWVGRRWFRIAEEAASSEHMAAGVTYALQGQTRALELGAAAVTGLVQGRRYRAYKTTLAVAPFSDEQWGDVVQRLADDGVVAARLLAGELPLNIEDFFAPAGLHLFPADPAEVTPSCECGHPGPWCKHACCLAALAAEALERDPFQIFLLRGLSPEE
ncbi:MAG: hypothetical protein VYC34_06550, partial [Planctomycetota bacterium]|nr:hypothetical protein [Planctomycetota bacterium]